MPIPAVSEYNWKRTQAVTTFVMGTDELDPAELSFQAQLETILNFTDGIEEVDAFSNISLADHGEWTHADLDTPYKARYGFEGRDRPHRPQISDEVARRLEEQVLHEYRGVPAEELDFDKQLDMMLNAAEEYFNELDCEIHFTRNT